MEQKLITTTYINNNIFYNYYKTYLNRKGTPFYLLFLSLHEFKIKQLSEKKFFLFCTYFFTLNFNLVNLNIEENIIINFLIQDMIKLNLIWRLIKGYPLKGQRTHSNAKQSKKNKILNNFRLNQFFFLFGRKKRNIYPTLIISEYTNKLWYCCWFYEWLQASLFGLKLVKPKINKVPIDPVHLSKNFTNGYIREGQAAKIGKSKKITKVATIGFPFFFSRWLYYDIPSREYPYKLWISDETRKKMGKKRKKNKKK